MPRYERCPNCMKIIVDGENVCTNCNFDIAGYVEKDNCLKPFTVLENKYMVGRVIGVGGFGITYIGWDMNLQTYIAIKEYFPDSLASRDTSKDSTRTIVTAKEKTAELYNKGLKRYVEEAQNLSKFYNLQGIVSVKDFFYENATAYIVMEYVNGINLKEYLRNYGGRLDENTVLSLMKPVFESLYKIHNTGLIHRDISPDNIMVDANGQIKLIDFGSARVQSQESEKTYTVILKHGYAPPEQYYSKGNQGPWTDIYSLCATMYRMLTGQIPPNSVERMEKDDYLPPSRLGANISPRTEAVIGKGLAVRIQDRYANIGELMNDLYGDTPVENISANAFSRGADNMQLAEPEKPQKEKKGKGAKIAIGAAVAIAVFAVIGLISNSISKKDKDTEETTAVTTETVNQTEATTEAASPSDAQSTSYSYEWPTEMSDNWEDYMIMLDGTIYQFPMPYTEWKLKGWRANDIDESIAGTDYETYYFDNGDACVGAMVYNYNLNSASIDKCFVVGVSINADLELLPEGYEVELPGGIKLGESNTQDIKAAFGAPDDYYISDDGSYASLDYDGDLDEAIAILSLDMDENDKLKKIYIGNTASPEGYVPTESEVSSEAPEINSKYVAPTGPSQAVDDRIITVDGTYYKLPVPVSEFFANGWQFSDKDEDYLVGHDFCYMDLEKNGDKISICLENLTDNAVLVENAMVTMIEVEENYCDIDVMFPGDICLGENGQVIEDLFGEYENYSYSTDFPTFNSYNVYFYDSLKNEISISVFTDKDNNNIYDIKYDYDVYGDLDY